MCVILLTDFKGGRVNPHLYAPVVPFVYDALPYPVNIFVAPVFSASFSLDHAAADIVILVKLSGIANESTNSIGRFDVIYAFKWSVIFLTCLTTWPRV